MRQNQTLSRLILILVLLAVVIYVDYSSNTSFFGLRSTETKLGLDLRGGLRVMLEADVPQDVTVTSQELQDAIQILENRSNGLGVSEVNFQVSGNRRIVGEFPGLKNTEEVIAVLKETGQLAFVPLGKNRLTEGTTVKLDLSALNSGTDTGATSGAATTVPTLAPTDLPTQAAATTPAAGAPGSAAANADVVYQPIMSGADLESVSVTKNKIGNYAISFVLKPHGQKIFADYTTAHVGDYLAIVLDNKIISAPTIQTPITEGRGQIDGSLTYDSANNLAIQLRYGSLPIPLKVVESRLVGASLGQDSVNKSILAGSIGLIMVILFMIGLFRLPGLVSSLALALYALTTFALYKLIPVTLTLPGIAGFVLSIGVAVDANILIFERLKEELRSGRNLTQSIDLGWQRAWPSIRDSNITTLISCTILFWFGSAFGATLVKGFALTLALGVAVSLFTAVFVTRVFLHLVLDNLKFTEHPRWFGV